MALGPFDDLLATFDDLDIQCKFDRRYFLFSVKPPQFNAPNFLKKMAENKSIWVKYLDLNPVEIDTLYFNDQERKLPLTNVADLIAAFKQRSGSLLANTDEGLITISINGSLEALDPGDLLSELPLTTDDNPLIIKSRNDGGNLYL